MKTHLKLEELALMVLAFGLMVPLGVSWWLVAALFLAPDVSFFGYLAGPRVGAWCYNFLHSRLVAIVLICVGVLAHLWWAHFIGLLLLAHVSFDRMLGYGLKYEDAFTHTHLGWLKPPPANKEDADLALAS